MPRIFFIVARDEDRLFSDVRRSFHDVPDVLVMFDRRRGERRQRDARDLSDDRRRGDRRENFFLDDRLRSVGWTIARPLTDAS